VIDRVPRQLSDTQSHALAALTRQVQAQMELRRNLLELKAALKARDEAEAAREVLIGELQQQLDNVKRLSSLLPLSSTCKFDMTVPAEPASIDRIVSGVLSLTGHMRAAEGRDFEVETALREALSNAIVHGCGGDASKQIQCSVACDQDGDLLVVIRDPGRGFDLSAVPDPTADDALYRSHGRGLYLINQLVDDVEFTMRRSRMGAGTGIEVRFRAGKRSA
jgi:serine/threonine-protein kinase RsbW